MTARAKDLDRRVVPRWNSLSAAIRQGELSASTARTKAPPYSEEARLAALLQRTADWEEHRTPAFAADLVATALVLGRTTEALEAAKLLLDAEHAPLAQESARRLLGETVPILSVDDDFEWLGIQETRNHIGRLKREVREDPRASLLWGQLSRWYASVGQPEKARESMAIAIALTSSDRFLLRSAARLSLHLDEPDRAHNLLTRSAATTHDPWLVAAEIAIAPIAGRASRLHKYGQRLVASGKFRPIAISELASALGTEVLVAGSGRKARGLFKLSLSQPTENAVAQAQWASQQGAGFDFEERLLDVEDSFEARANFFASEGNVKEALKNSWEWLREQPFASLPAIFGSYRAAVAQLYDESIRFAEFGLVANPDEFLLKNNLAFALASIGRAEDADAQLARIDRANLSEEHRLVFKATCGLVAFRHGDLETGRELYAQTMREATDPALRVIAAILLAREEINAGTPFAAAAQYGARELASTIERHTGPREETISDWLSQLNEPARV